MPVQKVCVVCGKEFFVPPARAESAKTCSNECGNVIRAKSRQKRITLSCRECGKPFDVPQSHEGRRIFCSHNCRNRNPGYLADIATRTSGQKNPKWNGGRARQSDGYVLLRKPDHVFQSNGYVLEHRLVVEKALREQDPGHPFLVSISGVQYLRRDLDVHHLNEDKSDNQLANLAIVTYFAHQAFHHGAPIGCNEVWPVRHATKSERKNFALFRCDKCSKFFEAPKPKALPKQNFCSSECYPQDNLKE